MARNHILNKPIEIVTSKDEKVIQARVNEYDCFGCNYDPANGGTLTDGKFEISKIYDLEISNPITDYDYANSSLELDERLEEISEILRYDDYGNPVEIKNHNTGINTFFIWGYNGQYPILIADDIDYQEYLNAVGSVDYEAVLSNLSNLDDDNCRGTSGCNEAALRSKLQELSNLLNEGSVTAYTYDPEVGMTSQIDINGYPQYYEYDNLNRLELIRDYEDNIVERYRYNYGKESGGIDAEIGISGSYEAGQTITFSANEVKMFGPGEFNWNIDGRIIENDGTAFQHTFLRSGTHWVRLEVNNPEYHGTRSHNKTITVYEESNPTICSPPSYDVCTNYQGYDPNECTPQTNSLEAKIVTVINGMNNAEAVDYHWEWRANIQSSGWSTFGDSSPVSELQESLFVGPISFVRIRCTVSYCGIEEVLETTVSIINANGNCP